MSDSLEKIKEQIAQLREKRPAYKEVLNFYERIVGEQERIKPALNVTPVKISESMKKLQMKEGFPLINKEDFTLDIFSSVRLFESLCQIGKNATDKMREDIQEIEEAVRKGAIDVEDLLKKHYDEAYKDKIAEDLDIDNSILKFLIHMSIMPSINFNVEKLKDQVDLKLQLKGYCPLCGSFPKMSKLKEEGQRYFLCSFCGFEWPGERLKCPYCENRDQETLHYFYAEGQEIYRVDVCDKCQQYTKTVDTRKLDYEPNLNLEDITTTHFDILAYEKGFKKPVPNPWGP